MRNPYYEEQVTRYSLHPEVVDCLLFCTKNPGPVLSRIHELDAFASYWFVTITPYGKEVEPHVPPVEQVIHDSRELAKVVGSHRVCWRYDPIFIDGKYSVEQHIASFRRMAKVLSGYVDECVISFIDLYAKTKRNFPGIRAVEAAEKVQLARAFSRIGKQYNIILKTCAEAIDLRPYGIQSSGCMAQEVMEKAIGSKMKNMRHKPQRANCGCCVPSRDIGAYNTCLHGCKYCYANYDQEIVKNNMCRHDPDSPLLLGKLSDNDIVRAAVQESYVDRQLELF